MLSGIRYRIHPFRHALCMGKSWRTWAKLLPSDSQPKPSKWHLVASQRNYSHTSLRSSTRSHSHIARGSSLALGEGISTCFWANIGQILIDLLRIILRIAVQMGSDRYKRLVLCVVLEFSLKMVISCIIARVDIEIQSNSISYGIYTGDGTVTSQQCRRWGACVST